MIDSWWNRGSTDFCGHSYPHRAIGLTFRRVETPRGAGSTNSGGPEQQNPPTDEELPIAVAALPWSRSQLVIPAAAVGGRFGELTAFPRKRFIVNDDDALIFASPPECHR
ncbi:hypothetical protein ACLQ3C_03855 [Gordonia sp. DT30]|uniref:hypothetical protein n=1 Tax=unclassified Gordonia (in: high G+C Gram-positive bacteria) TaxID=2657482 RepID=UPI003CF1A69E